MQNTHTIYKLRFTVKAFLIIFFIVLFEGALRKWLFIPGIPLMLLRDGIVFVTILYGLKNAYYKFKSLPEFILLIWTFLVIVWSLLQFLFDIMPFPVIFIGIRSWLLYGWFAVLFYRTVSKSELVFIIKILLATLIPMVILAVIQHLSAPTAFINRQAGGDEQFIFTVVSGIVRTTGTFTFTAGYTTYLAFISPFVLWLMVDGGKFITHYYYRITLIGSYFLGVLVSGSRGAIFLTIGMLMIWFLTLLFVKRPKISSRTILLLPIFLVMAGYFLAPIIERAFEANESRIESASQSEDVIERIQITFIGSDEIWKNFDMGGQGIGAGSNAARKFMPATDNGFLLGENEIDRILNEGGVLGIFFELLKVTISFLGLLISFKILINKKNSLPILVWTFLTIQLLTGSMTGQITAHAFTFLALAIGWSLLMQRNRKML